MRRLRILIADDHALIRAGVGCTLTQRSGWEICGEACDGREAVKKALDLKPDIAILDISMPRLNGLEATRQIRRAQPATEVLILTAHDTEDLVRASLAAGARGYMVKNDADAILLQAVESLAHHRPFFASSISNVVLEGYLSQLPESRPTDTGRLSPREREILQLVAEGKSNKEVAHCLAISVKTAEAHRTNIMRKLNLHSATALVRYAIRNKIIEP